VRWTACAWVVAAAAGCGPEIAADPDSGGTTDSTGRDATSDVVTTESTLRDDEVGPCIARPVKTWRFPAFDGDDVTVVYPFVLEPG
jgi:hypothetical protein